MNTKVLLQRQISGNEPCLPARRYATYAHVVGRLGLATLAAALLTASSARADFILDADFGLNVDNNLNHAGYVAHAYSDLADPEDASAVTARVAPGQYLQLTDRTGLTLQAELGGEVYPEFDSLNNVIVGGSAALRTKLGLGANVPWVRVGVLAARDEFASSTRDAWAFGTSVAAGKQFGDRWSLQAQYLYEGRRADTAEEYPWSHRPGDVFDTDAHSVGLSGTFAITSELAVQFSYTYRYGDVVAVNNRDYEIYEYSDAVTADDAFAPGQIAYRSVMNTNIFAFGVSHAVSEHISLNLGYRYEESDNDYFEYDNHAARFAILYSY
jgi:hypothetical protein